ncbi:MAG: nuclear transport factor 2 family protein [Melioribacteraceae bacterium]
MKINITIIILLLALTASAQNKKNIGPYYSEKEEKEILKVMENQAKAWNKGSVEGYMHGYWKSDSLRFVAKIGVQYGWNMTFDMYKKNYNSKEEMGSLSLKAVALEFMNKNVVFMIGRWQIEGKKSVGGHYTQIWKKINGKWVITVDHTS